MTTFKASNNELATTPAALAGFESLEVLDLHGNCITTPFPASFGTLSNLTNLNLSNNAIDAWPVELMALVHLKVLDLSHNKLTSLWGLDWKKDTVQRMQEVKRDTKKISRVMRGEANGDSSFDSIDSESTAPDSSAGEDFCECIQQRITGIGSRANRVQIHRVCLLCCTGQNSGCGIHANEIGHRLHDRLTLSHDPQPIP